MYRVGPRNQSSTWAPQFLAPALGGHGILYPHRLKTVGEHVPRLPHWNAPMGAGGLMGRRTPKIFSPPWKNVLDIA